MEKGWHVFLRSTDIHRTSFADKIIMYDDWIKTLYRGDDGTTVLTTTKRIDPYTNIIDDVVILKMGIFLK